MIKRVSLSFIIILLYVTLVFAEAGPDIKVRGRNIYVDGKKFYIKAVAYGYAYPGMNPEGTDARADISLFEKDFKMIKEAGINTIRTYKPLPPEVLDLAEKYGLFVIEGICYPCDTTDFSSVSEFDMLCDIAVSIVERDRNRKCILMWSLWNDAPWGWQGRKSVFKNHSFKTVNDFLCRLIKKVREADNTRPLTAANTFAEGAQNLGAESLDVLGVNCYLGLANNWKDFSKSDALNKINALRKLSAKYNKPVYIAECGYSTFDVKNIKIQAEVIKKQIKIAMNRVAGITVFEWVDEWWKAGQPAVHDAHVEEHWGICDGYRNPKPGYYAVMEEFSKYGKKKESAVKHKMTVRELYDTGKLRLD
ncbi:MAG: glycoside hydrolase family 2 TIM barrel-domain containing protein [bacterium]|nr:glycoside hydrolase family 2 TIM barrel-domain containing protein [bacterium]